MPAVRDPQALLQQTLQGWNPDEDMWVFGYASLIWNPEVEHTEHRLAKVQGYHRALKMWSRINRGTPGCPGLVFALISGGTCKGMVLRVPKAQALDELHKLWRREMPTGVYDPRWLPCHTAQGPVRALAFTLSRQSPNYTGNLPPQRLLQILSEACGRYGTTLDYVLRTDTCLRAHGIEDRAVAAVLSLARAHRLL
ncbi:cation transport protein ChaC [Caldimonas brevitalea]|uniref:glutathione-specific gamma-glutamylcyclotransferase n=1 Tax=Caldimonas brevitalea TaxID=413882 RepID=A0A0G3BFP8_9BURK|nr:cation transport protein ChaC [Caldimonas brevitalea]